MERTKLELDPQGCLARWFAEYAFSSFEWGYVWGVGDALRPNDLFLSVSLERRRVWRFIHAMGIAAVSLWMPHAILFEFYVFILTEFAFFSFIQV